VRVACYVSKGLNNHEGIDVYVSVYDARLAAGSSRDVLCTFPSPVRPVDCSMSGSAALSPSNVYPKRAILLGDFTRDVRSRELVCPPFGASAFAFVHVPKQ
jgi:hypothetical protein